MARIKAAD